MSAGVDVCRTDLEHRLAARERELRALAAEKDVLSQQARAAWSLLDERTAAAHELEVRPPPCTEKLSRQFMGILCLSGSLKGSAQ